MTNHQATITGLKTQIDLIQLSKVIDCCQGLAAILREYAVTPSHYDEDAFEAVQTANTVIHDANLALARLQGSQEVCSDCHCPRSDAEADEGWNPEARQCFSCAESVYRLCEKFNIFEDTRDADRSLRLDILRAKLQVVRQGPLKDQIEACLTFSK